MIDRIEAFRRRLERLHGRHGRTARRLHGAEAGPTDGQAGLLLIQIDGLGFDVLQRARAEGRMPNFERLMGSEPYLLRPSYAGVPSSTPAFQAELFYGERTAVPAYSFVHRATDQVFRMSNRIAAGTIEAGLLGRGVLGGGSSYGNIYHGGASVSRFSMASFGWGDLFRSSRPRALPGVVLTHFFDLSRAFALSASEAVRGFPDLMKAVRSGEPLRVELHFLQSRVAVVVVLREALATLASIDLARGLPVVHLDLLGYDEWAHRRGPSSAEAMRALRGIDKVLGRLTGTARRSHQRHYDIWVFSDHGQETTQPYIELHGRPVAAAVSEVLRRHGIEHQDLPEAPRGIQGQRVAMLGTRLAETLVPGLEITPRRRDPSLAVTTALGPLGHVYLPVRPDQDELSGIAAELVSEAHVPLVLCADGRDRALAWTASGRFRLPDDAAAILGEQHPFLAEAARDLVRVCQHRDAGDLVLSGWRLDGPPLSFPHENGSHAGPGPSETRAFVCAPADTPIDWSRPAIGATELRAAALDVLEGSNHRPTARWTRRPDAASLRLLTYNVHGCVGLDGVRSADRIARVIARYEPDVVALQEIDVARARSGGIDQAREIAHRLGLLMHFHPTFEAEGEQFGNAVLSRPPMEKVRFGPLPLLPGRPDLEPRGVMWVEVDTGDAVFQILNTHLSIHPRERRIQVKALMSPDWVGGLDPDANVVLCGDFNAGPGFPTCRTIGRTLTDVQVGLDGHRPRRTWGGRYPLARIDHIFVGRSLEVVHVDVPGTHLTRTASDHLPLFADIRRRAPG
jgi:endonuclease/exonuclease/phosphatase family metal-dependent hydrolase